MTTIQFSTTDTDVATGRAVVHEAINNQCKALGIGGLFPSDSLEKDHIHLEIPGTAISHLAPVPYQSALSSEIIIVDTADGLTSRPGETKEDAPVITGYRFDMYVRPRFNPALSVAIEGIITAPWLQASDNSRSPSEEELKLDPDRPSFVWKENEGVRFHGINPPRVPKHQFA